MRLIKLYKLMLLFLFLTKIISSKDEKSNNKLELFSNVETKIKKKSKTYDLNPSFKKDQKKIGFKKRYKRCKKHKF